VPVLDATPNGESGGGDGHSLLSGCALPAWSAVIHRPAEDSEPDELPSTVDMDAIKVRHLLIYILVKKESLLEHGISTNFVQYLYRISTILNFLPVF
jgi:hypothetical protein